MEKDIRTLGEYQLTDALQLMVEQGERMTAFPVDAWYDCGKPETLLSTNRALLARRSASRRIEGVVINDPVFVAPTAVLTNCVIGPNTTVGDYAVIEDSIVQNSIVSEYACVRRTLLENSIVGNGSQVEGTYTRVNVGDSSQIEFS